MRSGGVFGHSTDQAHTSKLQGIVISCYHGLSPEGGARRVESGDKVLVPERYLVAGGIAGNRVVQAASAAAILEVGEPIIDDESTVIGYRGALDGEPLAVMLATPYQTNGHRSVVAIVPPLTPDGPVPSKWILPAPSPIKPKEDNHSEARRRAAKDSWKGQVKLVEGREESPGLRPPQVGAVYGVLSHWKSSDGAATVVMPTGTGKTETMLTLLVHEQFDRLLVMVPSDALRDQISRKFETLGMLRGLGVLAPGASNPVVGRLAKKPRTAAEARDLFERCNVVVSTVAALAGLPDEVKRVVSDVFDTLFIDEAHHVAAATWTELKNLFSGRDGKRIIQFTATPFREDGKLVDGKVVFRFPMKRAMQQGYFRKIHYLPVEDGDEDEADADIARKAIAQLESDMEGGFDHVIMARTKSRKRAAEVVDIYRRLAPEHRPLCIHSGLPKRELEAAKETLRNRQTRIIVCVDMLGEGFDFPNLKIAALHDPHRSLAVTLQFVGRFTRDGKGLGDATAIGSLADPRMDDRIQALYAEDADWNALLDDLSEGQTHASVARSEFLAGFGDTEDDLVSLRRIFPKMSTAVFRTNTREWKPHKMEDGLGIERNIRMGPKINETRRAVLAVTEESVEVPWGQTKVVFNTVWHLFLAHWDENERLLFINTSDHRTSLKALAEALTGGDVEPVESEDVFKPFQGIARMTLLNIGLKHRMGRFTRFSMLVGPDVAQGMSPANVSGKSKTNVFVTGKDSRTGRLVTLGASTKGRIWSYAKARDMSEWVDWCQGIGRKIRDSSIRSETVLEGAMMPTPIDTRPVAMPLSVEWPTDILVRSEETVILDAGMGEVPILNASLEPIFNEATDPLRFILRLEAEIREFEVQFGTVDQGARFIQTRGSAVYIKVGKRRGILTDWFNENPPCITFADLSELEGNFHFDTTKKVSLAPIRDDHLIPWGWSHPVDITKESHRRHPPTTSLVAVQTHVFGEIAQTGWAGAPGFAYDVIFDDDGSGEAADIVALATTPTEVMIDLFHCKYSSDMRTGARVGDLYEVCGQSARSMRWVSNPAKLIEHLIAREKSGLRSAAGTRFILGDNRALRRYTALVAQRRVTFRVFAVQPGLSKRAAFSEPKVRDILASVDNYLRQSAEFGLRVICSP